MLLLSNYKNIPIKEPLTSTLKRSNNSRHKVLLYMIGGASFGLVYACFEYAMKLGKEDEQLLVPLLIRASLAGAMILATVAIFEVRYKNKFTGQPFIYLVLVRSFFYVFIITIWLLISNAIWYSFNGLGPVLIQLRLYYSGNMFFVNVLSVMPAVVVVVGLSAINSLHRKRELINFILGRYHTPREVDRIFCFIDLKNSTTIAEKLGHMRFAMFLKDYFSDISEALRMSDAQIYQYIGDEIVLSWSFEDGLKNNNMIHCCFLMREILEKLKSRYIERYEEYPEFRAGLHGGQVIVTWIGELKKEIVYIGDVVNTTARIREDCKRLEKDILISQDLLNSIEDLSGIKAVFVEETIPRGKAKSVRLYSLEKVDK